MKVNLLPLGAELDVAEGFSLRSSLFQYGVEFPCGGVGDCGSCKVRVMEGAAAPNEWDQHALSEDQIAQGWRLACHLRAESAMTLLVEQWDSPVLADCTPVAAGVRKGFGVAVDLGTTTIVVQLVDLASGMVLAVRTALNAQSAHGSDIMSRIEVATREDTLTRVIRESIGSLVRDVAGWSEVADVVVVGNTAMHHIFCGLDARPLSHVPFRSPTLGEQAVDGMRFLRCLGGFVGSDLLAGIVATGIHQREELCALVDLGTNGEIVVGNRERLLCGSTAAGPAFEAGRISIGMRASTGAIAHVRARNGCMECEVIGEAPARGICGSGLVDAAAAGLDFGLIRANGRLTGASVPLCDGLALTQADLRELQLAKGAIAAGLTMLVEQWGGRVEDLSAVYLAGAFGNYVDPHNAQRIGLIPVDPARIHASGNTALRGARMLLLDPALGDAVEVEHVELSADPSFQDRFAEAMAFTCSGSSGSPSLR